jgi:3-isopropylmalate dehydrogenase
MQEAEKIMDKISEKFNIKFEKIYGLIGGAAYDKFQEHFPQQTKEIVKNVDAVLFGSVGGPVDKQMEPKWKNCERNSIL